MQRDRGFALLIVLWSLVLLSLIMTRVMASGRTQAQLAGNLRNAAIAEAAADGAVQEAAFHLAVRGPEAWSRRGIHEVRVGAAAVRIVIDDPADKINPNNASERLLRALLGLCGAETSEARKIARSVQTWRGDPGEDANSVPVAYRAAHLPYLPPAQPLQTIDELGLVLGMTKPLLACITPHLSLYQDGAPNPQSGDRVVAQAAALAEQEGDPPQRPVADPTRAIDVTATAQVVGALFTRRATIRLSEHGLFRILTWETL